MTRARDIANVTVTPTFPDGSINIADLNIDGGTDIGAALVDADLMVVDDGAGGTNRKATMSRLATYMGGKITGGSMVYLASSGAISGAASVAFTQFDASKYDHYQFWLQHVIPATDAVGFEAQTSTDGGSNYATTDGDYHMWGATDKTGLCVAGNNTINVGSDTNEFGVSGIFLLYAPHNSSSYTYASGYNIVLMDQLGRVYSNLDAWTSMRLAAEDVDAIRFIMTSGNIESGEIVMYGIANGS